MSKLTDILKKIFYKKPKTVQSEPAIQEQNIAPVNPTSENGMLTEEFTPQNSLSQQEPTFGETKIDPNNYNPPINVVDPIAAMPNEQAKTTTEGPLQFGDALAPKVEENINVDIDRTPVSINDEPVPVQTAPLRIEDEVREEQINVEPIKPEPPLDFPNDTNQNNGDEQTPNGPIR